MGVSTFVINLLGDDKAFGSTLEPMLHDATAVSISAQLAGNIGLRHGERTDRLIKLCHFELMIFEVKSVNLSIY